jgi:hypothetical protein
MVKELHPYEIRSRADIGDRASDRDFIFRCCCPNSGGQGQREWVDVNVLIVARYL